MDDLMRTLGRVILIVAVTAGCGFAQQTAPEKHVADIRAEQPPAWILASPLCQRTRENLHVSGHGHNVAPSTLLKDLDSLMEKSDEVVLASPVIDDLPAISPSGEDAIEYFDVVVLRTWKGSHKVGDTLTAALPVAGLRCTASLASGEPMFVTATSDWKGMAGGPYLLFLRHSQGDEAQLLPDLRVTGGDGLQGLFSLRAAQTGTKVNCGDTSPGDIARCNALVNTSQMPVSVRYLRDPLLKKYDGMPISKFLDEVQAVADSQGYPAQAEVKK